MDKPCSTCGRDTGDILAHALRDAAEIERQAAEIVKLQARQAELLVTIRNLSASVPYPEEAQNAGILIAEVGTLRARVAEIERRLGPQFDGDPAEQFHRGSLVYVREAIDELRRQRDNCIGDRLAQRRALTLTASNLRDAFAWLWPHVWTDDPEFVPFTKRIT